MKLSQNTILITGGGSGIGLALAEALKAEGNVVIVAGRSAEKLKLAATKGLHTLSVNLLDVASIYDFAKKAVADFPSLNVVIHNAGVMMNEKLISRDQSKIALETIATNLTAPIILTNALLPHFLIQQSAAIVTVTSGLAFVPLVMCPTYSASKAAIHSYTQSLRYQLKDTAIEVKELVPPYVRTSLMGARQANDQNAMDLKDFVKEVMLILKEDPSGPEVLVKRVIPQRTAADLGPEKYNEFFELQTEVLMNARKAEWEAL